MWFCVKCGNFWLKQIKDITTQHLATQRRQQQQQRQHHQVKPEPALGSGLGNKEVEVQGRQGRPFPNKPPEGYCCTVSIQASKASKASRVTTATHKSTVHPRSPLPVSSQPIHPPTYPRPSALSHTQAIPGHLPTPLRCTIPYHTVPQPNQCSHPDLRIVQTSTTTKR